MPEENQQPQEPAARERFLDRIGDWSENPPEIHTPESWDWRTIPLEDLDPITLKMVQEARKRAEDHGIALANAPADLTELFLPPYPPFPEEG